MSRFSNVVRSFAGKVALETVQVFSKAMPQIDVSRRKCDLTSDFTKDTTVHLGIQYNTSGGCNKSELRPWFYDGTSH